MCFSLHIVENEPRIIFVTFTFSCTVLNILRKKLEDWLVATNIIMHLLRIIAAGSSSAICIQLKRTKKELSLNGKTDNLYEHPETIPDQIK